MSGNCSVHQASALPGSQASLAVEYTLKVGAPNTVLHVSLLEFSPCGHNLVTILYSTICDPLDEL
jgi:hypothetical protein